MRRLLAAALFPLLVTACSGEPTGPPPEPYDGSARAAKIPKESSSPSVAIEDAIERLLPALDATTSANLRGPLNSIASLLKEKSKDKSAWSSAFEAADAALAAPLAANDERAPDLAAIALALAAAR